MIHNYDRLMLWGVDIQMERYRLKRAKRKARVLGLPANLPRYLWCECLLYWCVRCAYCGAFLRRVGEGVDDALTLEHFIPLSAGGGSTPDNVIPVCWKCNDARLDIPIDEWLANTFPAQHHAIYTRIVEYFSMIEDLH